MNLHPKVVENFNQNIDKTDYCWNWTGTLGAPNLPIICFSVDGKRQTNMARRVSVILAGKTLDTSEHVKPLICHNNLCVNPDHLVFGNEARFYSYVHKNSEDNGGCWVWIGSIANTGYGAFYIYENGNKIQISAHQYSWQLANNFKLSKDSEHFICHKCDHPYCVNPNHLFLGTAKENSADMIAKNRQAKGEENGQSKLTDPDVINIRELFQAGGVTQTQLSLQFGVSKTTISDVIRRKVWKHI
jgi:hypothetical protein